MKAFKFYLLAIPFIFGLTSCGDDIVENYYPEEDYKIIQEYLNLPNGSLDYKLTFPSYYRTTERDFSPALATLGRVLFYDKNLSSDRSISCASCHKQSLAFSDDKSFSDGVESRQTSRNSLPLGAVFSFVEYYGSSSSGRVPFFWDNRATSVQEQARQTFANEKEMNMPMDQVVSRVRELPYYAPLLKATFGGSEEVDEDKVLAAVSEFVNALGSFDSKFDRELSSFNGSFSTAISDANRNFPGYTAQENQGKSIYMNNCSSCHGAIMGLPGAVQSNNGLDLTYEDKGVGEWNADQVNNGTFKVPTLRNISLTYPYMHDGRFETLEEVVDHYSAGIQDHPNLDPLLKVGGVPKQFNYSEEEKAALIAFLHTLTDDKYLTAEKYADPFK